VEGWLAAGLARLAPRRRAEAGRSAELSLQMAFSEFPREKDESGEKPHHVSSDPDLHCLTGATAKSPGPEEEMKCLASLML
jgi:hypothetical protein